MGNQALDFSGIELEQRFCDVSTDFNAMSWSTDGLRNAVLAYRASDHGVAHELFAAAYLENPLSSEVIYEYALFQLRIGRPTKDVCHWLVNASGRAQDNPSVLWLIAKCFLTEGIRWEYEFYLFRALSCPKWGRSADLANHFGQMVTRRAGLRRIRRIQ